MEYWGQRKMRKHVLKSNSALVILVQPQWFLKNTSSSSSSSLQFELSTMKLELVIARILLQNHFSVHNHWCTKSSYLSVLSNSRSVILQVLVLDSIFLFAHVSNIVLCSGSDKISVDLFNSLIYLNYVWTVLLKSSKKLEHMSMIGIK